MLSETTVKYSDLEPNAVTPKDVQFTMIYIEKSRKSSCLRSSIEQILGLQRHTVIHSEQAVYSDDICDTQIERSLHVAASRRRLFRWFRWSNQLPMTIRCPSASHMSYICSRETAPMTAGDLFVYSGVTGDFTLR